MGALMQTLRNLGPTRLALMGIVVFGLIGFFIFLTTKLSVPGMTLLYADLAQEDSGRIISQLQAQQIPYEIPNESFGIIAPPLVLSQNRGDCDSKSLLGRRLLALIGVDSVLLHSVAHHHVMLGVALPIRGDDIPYNGRRYSFVEMTSPWPLGRVSPDYKRPFDWKVVPLPP